MKLSPRARLLLRLVNSRTERDAAGNVTCFFVPSHLPMYLTAAEESIWVYGGSDATAFESLVRRGLIYRTKPGDDAYKYWFATTPEGKQEAEKL